MTEATSYHSPQARGRSPLALIARLGEMLFPLSVILLMQRWFVKGLVDTEK